MELEKEGREVLLVTTFLYASTGEARNSDMPVQFSLRRLL